MLDQNIIEQLKSVYQALENEVALVVAKSNHKKQNEMLEMMRAIASTSNKISLQESEEVSPFPKLSLKYNGKQTGVNFVGIPGGHEFTSLILSILHADGKGKLPDTPLRKQVTLEYFSSCPPCGVI